MNVFFFCIRTQRCTRVGRLYNKLRKPPCVTSEFIRNIVWPGCILMRIKSKANFKAGDTRSVAQREITNMPLSLWNTRIAFVSPRKTVAHTLADTRTYICTKFEFCAKRFPVDRKRSITHHIFGRACSRAQHFETVARKLPGRPYFHLRRLRGSLEHCSAS